MLKERDNDVLSEELRNKFISHVPNKYLLMRQEPRWEEETGVICIETVYTLKECHLKKSVLHVPEYIRSTEYLGIIYPSGRTRYKKVQRIKYENEHKQFNFYV